MYFRARLTSRTVVMMGVPFPSGTALIRYSAPDFAPACRHANCSITYLGHEVGQRTHQSTITYLELGDFRAFDGHRVSAGSLDREQSSRVDSDLHRAAVDELVQQHRNRAVVQNVVDPLSTEMESIMAMLPHLLADPESMLQFVPPCDGRTGQPEDNSIIFHLNTRQVARN